MYKSRILVVDDEPGLRDMLVFDLTDRGHEVVAIDDPRLALDRLRRESFDLVICDVMMPGLSGMDLLKSIKAVSPGTSVVMVTGSPTKEAAAESVKLGACDYIAKPYELDPFYGVIQKALERSSPPGS